MAAEPAPPGGTVRQAWLLVAQWEPEKKQTKKRCIAVKNTENMNQFIPDET